MIEQKIKRVRNFKCDVYLEQYAIWLLKLFDGHKVPLPYVGISDDPEIVMSWNDKSLNGCLSISVLGYVSYHLSNHKGEYISKYLLFVYDIDEKSDLINFFFKNMNKKVYSLFSNRYDIFVGVKKFNSLEEAKEAYAMRIAVLGLRGASRPDKLTSKEVNELLQSEDQ